MKKTVITLYIIVTVVMAAATIIEKYEGTSYVHNAIYGSWWFSLLWGLLTATSILYFLRQKVRKASTVTLHLSFVIILLGAWLTHISSEQGIIHLRLGEQTRHYLTEDMQEHDLPFTIRLDQFDIKYHEGTNAPADYISHLTITDGDHEQQTVVSMNHIASHQAVRLYQSSYDEDGRGSVLSMNTDPWGIPVTYCGYALLFVSLLWMLIDPRGRYRQLLRSPLLRKAAVAIVLLCATPSLMTAAPRVLPQATAERFGRLHILYNDRVCPMQTYAIDFTKKLYGRRNYGDYTAEQVLTGFIFFNEEWSQEPIIKVKGDEVKSRLNLPNYACVNSFFNANGYTLGPYIQEYYKGYGHERFHQQAAQIDEKLTLIMELQKGTPLKVFPYTDAGRTKWYAPTDNLPASMDSEHQKYMRNVFTLLNGEIQAGNYETANEYLDKMLRYQQRFGGRSLPSDTKVKAERLYNQIPFATILFMVCLGMGFVSFALLVFCRKDVRIPLFSVVLAATFLALSTCLALRWIVTGNIPMANGYETMLLLAWMIMLIALLTSCATRHYASLVTCFGFLLSGFFLLVSHISQMDPQMSHLMPVLNSPLLTLHVSIIMMAFALLSLTFISSLTALIVHPRRTKTFTDQLHLLSQLMLYPALACLGFGIFIGAIWANVSWGAYWSWDPKETWALITFMVYAIPAHHTLFPRRSSPVLYHVYMVLAFLTILMTYFGVNYFLGGMHSYA